MTMRPMLRSVADLTPAEKALHAEAEGRQWTAQEARAIEADTRALLARCEQFTRLNNTHPGFRNATVDLIHALRLKAPPLTAILRAMTEA